MNRIVVSVLNSFAYISFFYYYFQNVACVPSHPFISLQYPPHDEEVTTDAWREHATESFTVNSSCVHLKRAICIYRMAVMCLIVMPYDAALQCCDATQDLKQIKFNVHSSTQEFMEN